MIDPAHHNGVSTMTHAKRWRVEIHIDEHEDGRQTRAEARLHTGDDTHLIGIGTARRNPRDPEVPEIGDEVAVSRALSDLAEKLRAAAAADVEEVAEDASHGG
jgi:Rv2632c-like